MAVRLKRAALLLAVVVLGGCEQGGSFGQNAEISRENGFLARERSNLAALSYGVNVGRLGMPGAPGPSSRSMPRRLF